MDLVTAYYGYLYFLLCSIFLTIQLIRIIYWIVSIFVSIAKPLIMCLLCLGGVFQHGSTERECSITQAS